MNKKSFYVTTPIYYPTGTPHIGTAYTTFIADTLARYYRAKGSDTFFLTGTDEHGANIAKKAAEQGTEPKEYVDGQASIFRKLWSDLGISNDFFVQTTDPRHEVFIQELIQKSYDNGDIYEGSYEGWYCESCEAYISEGDLVDGKCPNHPTKEPVFTTEKNYYFKWSKYQDWLLGFYEQNSGFVVPEKWFNYVKEFVKAGLQDIPVTRANVKWGVPVPFDAEQTIYVWYDALPNYLSVLNFPEYAEQNYEDKFWPEVHHVIGKDIIKFHAILWPAMLKSAGYEPPKQVITHGFFTVNGQKIGKSNNNAINPLDLANKYGIDAVRYALLSEFQVGNDGDFSEDRLKVKYSSELANQWGNLLNRVVILAAKKNVPTDLEPEAEFKNRVDDVVTDFENKLEAIKIFEAIQQVNSLTDWGNKYITEEKPWEKEEAEAQQSLANLRYLLRKANELFAPITPDAADKAKHALETGEKVILFPILEE